MIKFLRRYWIECLIFAIIAIVLVNDVNPAWTWVNTDSDGAHYTLAAKYLYPAHNTSAPVFLLLGRLFLFLPFGTEAWRFGLLLAMSTLVASVLIYLIVRAKLRENNHARWYALIASVVYGGSALVISQSTIIDTYAFDTMLGLAAYYFVNKGGWIQASASIGLLWATHTLIAWVVWIPLLVQYKPLRDRVNIFITLSFLLFYLYLPIVVAVNHPPEMWNNTNVKGFLTGELGVLTMLTGTLSIYDLPKRILDTIGILGVSLGVGTIVLALTWWKTRKTEKALFWAVIIPIVYFITNLASETYVYLMPAIAFGAVLVGIGLSKMRIRWAYATAVVAVALLIFNANYFDIGRTLDPNMSAMKFYNIELGKIPDGEIFLGGRWNWAMVYLYNKEQNRNIIPISTDTLPSDDYLGQLERMGVKFVRPSKDVSMLDKQWMIALSIAEQNPNVWIVKDTKPSTYGAEMVKAKGNEYLLSQWIGRPIKVEWKWKPSNPYDFITGAIEVEQWAFVLQSNRNVLFYLGLAGLGWILNSWLWRIWDRKKGSVDEVQAKT